MITIFGIMELPNINGVQAYAIDGQTGEIIERHFCTNESFAKGDLGFSSLRGAKKDSNGDYEETTDAFNEGCNKGYKNKYPNGFKKEWVGYWMNHPKTTELYPTVQKQLKEEHEKWVAENSALDTSKL